MVDVNTPSPFSLHSSQDGDDDGALKNRYEYKEHSSYRYFSSMIFSFYKTYLLLFLGRHKGAYGKVTNPVSGFWISDFTFV